MTEPYRLVAALVSATSLAHQRLAEALREAAVSPSAFAVLLLLEAEEPREPLDLAAALGVSRPTTTGLLDTLERRGLLRRDQHPSDGRRLHVTLTEAGRAHLGRHRPAYEEACARLAAPLAPHEQERLLRLLARMEEGRVERDQQTPPDGG